MAEIALAIAVVALIVLVWAAWRIAALERGLKDPAAALTPLLEEKHRAMLTDLHTGLTQQGDRLGRHLTDSSERLSAKIDQRLDQIAGKVDERLDEGFKKTNETFVNVMQRLATIDEAQKKIESLTGSVVSLQELLGDKRSRGAFGEVQLEALVRNVLPPMAFELQYTLSNGMRVDCALRLPPPTGLVTVDSKFPLENYHRMFDRETDQAERALAQKQFKADIRKHVDDIARKYIIAGETSIMDRDDVTPQALRLAGGRVEHYGAPVEPGNLLLLGYLDELPVLGAPGCVRSRDVNIVDLLLPRLLAGERVTRRDIVELGHGGLLG